MSSRTRRRPAARGGRRTPTMTRCHQYPCTRLSVKKVGEVNGLLMSGGHGEAASGKSSTTAGRARAGHRRRAARRMRVTVKQGSSCRNSCQQKYKGGCCWDGQDSTLRREQPSWVPVGIVSGSLNSRQLSRRSGLKMTWWPGTA